MKAIILAAGRGSRLGSLSSTIPKCMVQLAGKPLIAWQLAALRKSGVSDIAIVRGYLKESFTFKDVSYFDNNDWAATNMVMSLYSAREWLKKEPCIISYSDIVYSSSIIKKLMSASTSNITISYDVGWHDLWKMRFENPLEDAETFIIDQTSKLLEIGKKTDDLKKVQGQYMGLLRFSPEGWETTEKFLLNQSEVIRNKLDMTSLLQKLNETGIEIKTMAIDEKWFEVDNENDLMIYEKILAKHPNYIPE
ncbi:MAG: NTP transferase domain-containing protein [Elusimicrobiota bacterium]